MVCASYYVTLEGTSPGDAMLDIPHQSLSLKYRGRYGFVVFWGGLLEPRLSRPLESMVRESLIRLTSSALNLSGGKSAREFWKQIVLIRLKWTLRGQNQWWGSMNKSSVMRQDRTTVKIVHDLCSELIFLPISYWNRTNISRLAISSFDYSQPHASERDDECIDLRRSEH